MVEHSTTWAFLLIILCLTGARTVTQQCEAAAVEGKGLQLSK